MVVRILYTDEFAPLFHQNQGSCEPEEAYLYLKDNTLFAGYESKPLPEGVSPDAPEVKWELTPYVSSEALNLLFDQISDVVEKVAEGEIRAVKIIEDFCSFVEAELDAFTVEKYYENLSEEKIREMLDSGKHVQDGIILIDIDEWKMRHPK